MSWLFEDDDRLEEHEIPWEEAEAKLRQWAFGVYFRKSFKRERNAELRFLKAMAASMRPIRSWALALWWYQHNGPITDVDLERLSVGSRRSGLPASA